MSIYSINRGPLPYVQCHTSFVNIANMRGTSTDILASIRRGRRCG